MAMSNLTGHAILGAVIGQILHMNGFRSCLFCLNTCMIGLRSVLLPLLKGRL